MISVLLIQCLLFADGGLLALGCNVWNMAFYGCFIGTLLIWLPIMKNGFSRGKIILASILGCVLTLQLGAFSVVLQTSISGISALPFGTFVGVMQPIHLAIGLVEGLIAAVVLLFVYEARPELLYGNSGTKAEGRFSMRTTAIVLAVCAILIGGGLSLAASEFPDGLEWSIEKITGSTEVESEGSVYESAESVQEATALLPDYAFKDSESAAGTSFSGIVGGAVVAVLASGICLILRKATKKNKTA